MTWLAMFFSFVKIGTADIPRQKKSIHKENMREKPVCCVEEHGATIRCTAAQLVETGSGLTVVAALWVFASASSWSKPKTNPKTSSAPDAAGRSSKACR